MVQVLRTCYCSAETGRDDEHVDGPKARRPDAESGRGSVTTSRSASAAGGLAGGAGGAPLGLSLGSRCAAPISRLRVEKIEGGLLVAGVVVAANCQVALPAFGALFALAGCVLTAAAYRGPAAGEDPAEYEARVSLTGSSRALGPACLAAGLLMLVAGAALIVLARRARSRQRRVGFHCPLHGDFYPLSPVAGLPGSLGGGGKPRYGVLCCRGPGGRRLWGAGRAPVPTPQCPHSTLSSTRSSVSSAPASPCPAPTPFLVTSGSVSSGLLPAVGASLSPDQTFGSIKSLAAGREVASFPLSRTPSPPPPPGGDSVPSDAAALEPPVLTVVAPAADDAAVSPLPTTPPKGPRKSVSIVLPEEQSGRG